MRLPSLFPSKKLRATTARRSLGMPDEMDYEEMSEPNMKLSRALLIVLLLHVVAVSGIIAFNAIKTRERSFVPEAPTQTENTPADPAGDGKNPRPPRQHPPAAPKKKEPPEHPQTPP